MNNAIGGVELSSIAKGLEAADAMLKASEITLLVSRSVCPGKYIILVSGEVGAVNAAYPPGPPRPPTPLSIIL